MTKEIKKNIADRQKSYFRFRWQAPVVCAMLVLFFCTSGFAQRKVVVKIGAEAIVKNDIIALGDIAQISGLDKSDLLRNITLGYAPNVGMTREIYRTRIVQSINAAGILSSEFSIESPEMIVIRRAGQHVEASLIHDAVEKAVLAYFSGSKVEPRIVQVDVPRNLEVPVGKIEIRTGMANIANPFVPFSLPIEIRINDKTFRRVSVNIEIEAFGEILVASRDLTVNSKISPGDVRIESRRLDKPFGNYLVDTDKLRGATLIKNLAIGAEITTDSFVSSVVIKSGDLVKIIGQSGKMQISVNGEARSNGKIGDRIAVKNSQSNATIQATVVDEGIVKIFF